MFKAWLTHPLTRGLNIDDPNVTHLRRRIIQEKPFLRQIYQEWYTTIATALPPGNEPVLELGSGAGFMKKVIPNLKLRLSLMGRIYPLLMVFCEVL